MSAIGIDFGNENCYVAVPRAGGIEIVTNDYSQRATPTYVGFGPTNRDLGTSAKNKFTTNIQNTVCNFKRIIGRKYTESMFQKQMTYLSNPAYNFQNGIAGFVVQYLGKEARFTINQIAAMILTKLKNITETAYQSKVIDCVIAVPAFFGDAERRAMLDICKIANINVLRLLNETAAVALAYGFYRQDVSESKPKKVVFIDIGHTSVQASICDIYLGKLQVLSSAYDPSVGGRDFDNCIVRYFSDEFKTKYNLNVLSSRRAIVRLLQECEKLKKQLSANPQSLPLNIECFMEDKDVSSSMGRDKFEELCGDLFIKIEAVFTRLLAESRVHVSDISAVEVVGGSTRIPAIKNIIKQVFKMEPSTTLNLDEAVARGCALQAAMLTPTVKVKDFLITDVQPYTIKLSWEISKNEKGDVEAFPRNHPIPFSKLLTFFRREDFTLNALYTHTSEEESLFGSFTVKLNQLPSGESAKVIVKLRINVNGIFNVCSAVIMDKDSKENMSVDQKAEDAMDVRLKSSNAPNDVIVNEEKKKDFFSLKKHKKTTPDIELPIECKVPQLSDEELKAFMEAEQRMINQDVYEERRINAKNSVEEFVYEMRNRLSEELKQYTTELESDDFQKKLNETENWIYDAGQDESEEIYKQKLNELRSIAEPIFKRKYEHDNRTLIIPEFQNIIQQAQQIINAYLSKDENYSHIEPTEMEQVQKAVHAKHNWLQQQLKSIETLKLYENPPITAGDLFSQKEQLKQEIYPILSKPKPQVVQPNDTPVETNATTTTEGNKK